MTRPLSRARRAISFGRRELPVRCGTVWRCGFLSCEVVGAASGHRFGCAGQDGRPSQACARSAPSLHSRADHSDAASDVTSLEGGAGCTRVKVSHSAVWLFLRRDGLRFKKTLFALEQARADVSRRRKRWQSWQAGLDTGRLVFIDETWIKTNMAPLRGWGPKGARLRSFAPHGHWRP